MMIEGDLFYLVSEFDVESLMAKKDLQQWKKNMFMLIVGYNMCGIRLWANLNHWMNHGNCYGGDNDSEIEMHFLWRCLYNLENWQFQFIYFLLKIKYIGFFMEIFRSKLWDGQYYKTKWIGI